MPEIVGTDPKHIHYVTCKSCSSVLRYTKSETRMIEHSHDYLGGFSRDRGITCPKCNSNVFVS